MKLFLGSDHGGYYLKEKLEAYLAKRGYDFEDVGDKELDPNDDFPQFAAQAAVRVIGEEEKDDPRAILICTGGQGMAMAANRFTGIRAVVVTTPQEAKESRDDNDANILCLPARLLDAPGDDLDPWKDIVETWLTTPFAGAARYIRRNRQLDELR
jgi:ribose 5-phosphate isomerase B